MWHISPHKFYNEDIYRFNEGFAINDSTQPYIFVNILNIPVFKIIHVETYISLQQDTFGREKVICKTEMFPSTEYVKEIKEIKKDAAAITNADRDYIPPPRKVIVVSDVSIKQYRFFYKEYELPVFYLPGNKFVAIGSNCYTDFTDLKAVRMSRFNQLQADDAFICKKNETNEDLAFLEKHGFMRCRFYIQRTVPRTWLVSASDIEISEIKGRLKQNNSLTSKSRTGLMVYSDSELNSSVFDRGNPVDILEPEEIFSVEDTETFTSRGYTGMHRISYKDGEKEGVVHIPVKDILQGRTKILEGYAVDGKIHSNQNIQIPVTACIGYTGKAKNNTYYYDLALFLENNFMETKTAIANEGAVYLYEIPENIQLYKYEKKEVHEVYIPRDTVFTCEEHSLNDKKAYKLTLSKMNLGAAGVCTSSKKRCISLFLRL